MAEFKIGRLRFTWLGQWAPSTFYNRDAVIQYNGKTYVCLVPNTASTNFYDDLYYQTPGGADQPFWNLVIDGTSWVGDWEATTLYSLSNLVRFGGVVYICTESHTSNTTTIDLTKFDTYAQYANWNNAWVTNHAYGVGDVVKYGGIVYVCTANHTSANTINQGLEIDFASWTVLNSGIEYKGAWSSSVKYKLNDIVKLNANLYIATLGHLPSPSFNEEFWEIWLPGEVFGNTWSSSVNYQPGDVVVYGGYTYVSNVVNNLNNIPSTETVEWSILNTGYNLRNEWTAGLGNSYKVGDVVRKHGMLYEAVADSSNQDPTAYSVTTTYTASGSSGTTVKVGSSTGITKGMIVIGAGFTLGQTVLSVTDGLTIVTDTAPDSTPINGQAIKFVGVNYVYWKILTPGYSWTDGWDNSTAYSIGDLAVWKNGTYTCIQNHTASPSNRPDADTTNTYWALYVPHARKNALTTYGDIETFDNDEYSAVAIGTETFTLRSTDATPVWSHINTIQRVYYVADTGLDQIGEGYGLTWDKPWRTLQYACSIVDEGSYYQNASYLLRENKNWLVSEMYYWMLYQVDQENTPFTSSSTFDEAKTRRDASYVIDAIARDITRGGNSQTVSTALAYFAYGSSSNFITDGVAAEMPYFIAALEELTSLFSYALSNSNAMQNYQDLMGVAENEQITQSVDLSRPAEAGASLEISSLINIIITALDTQSTLAIPSANSGISSTIMLKTGTYNESLPIIIPDNTAIVGDELRGAVVQPATIINTTVTATTADDTIGIETVSTLTVANTTGITIDTPIQFGGTMGGVTAYTTYYATKIDDTKIIIHTTPNSITIPVGLTDDDGSMVAYGGDAILDMFRMRNATGLRNMTLRGKLGFLGNPDANTLQQPTGGAYTTLDPGAGPSDTSVWIKRRSPYVQNVTAFGLGCTALMIDGSLHDGGNKSIVCNDYTHIISDGIGIWCTGAGALCEAVSVFSYFGYAGYYAAAGGRIRATNGNSSYGTYGVIAEGYDPTETPATGTVFNQSTQTQALVQSAFGATSELLKINYSNAGAEYDVPTTNLIKYSNDFTNATWTTDGNLTFSKITEAPSGLVEAWTMTGTSSTAGAGYLYQNITVNPKGATYTGLSAVNITGTGQDATFDVTVTSTGYLVTVNYGGTGYVAYNPGTNTGSSLIISGGQLGGRNAVNDCILTVTQLAGSSILNVEPTGTVPTGSALNYTLSAYVKAGTSNSIDFYGTFSGSSTVTSKLNYNFASGAITVDQSGGGFLPVEYGAEVTLVDGWYRLWFAINDTVGLNNQLQFRIYPRGYVGNAGGYSYVYGAQVELSNYTWLSNIPSFYLETAENAYTAYANFNITGAGTGVIPLGDEIRSNSIFETRITDPGSGAGGNGYLTASNNGQSGTTTYIQLAQSDNNTQSNYTGMRLFINSGTGAGQYGYISAYDETYKIAQILKESFDSLQIIEADAALDRLSLNSGFDTKTLYVDQAIQFIPTYYTTAITSTSLAQTTVTAAIGGLINTLTVASTVGLTVNMGVTFSGSVFSTVSTGYVYYIHSIEDDVTIKITDQLYGNVWNLTSQTGSMTMNFTSNTSYLAGSTTNMVVNYPIQFTGTSLGGVSVGAVYYINDVISGSLFSVSSALVEVTVTATNPSNSGFTVASTTTLVPLNPIIFTGTIVGGVVDGTKYYISSIIDINTFTISTTLITRYVTETQAGSNLITTSSTTGFVVNNPIQFVGTAFGNIVSETTYYILAINDGQTFTVSQTPGGSAISLLDATGSLIMRTAPTAKTVTSSSSASMTGTSTASKKALTLSIGSMNGTFSTALFGGISLGTTYYVKTIESNSQITISDSQGGATFGLTTKTGSMNLAAVGWDHINPGTPIETSLDNSTVYFIEPRTTFSEPTFQQDVGIAVSLSGQTWVSMAHGDHYWIALPSGNSTAAGSVDGEEWSAITLPSVQSWTGIAYGNGYWIAISSGGTGNSKAIYSNSNGLGWRTSNLPSATTWSHIAYGNGTFVAIAAGTSSAAYTSNYGYSWSSGTGFASATWTGLCYGGGKFLAVATGTATAKYSTDGISWNTTTLPTASSWSSVAYGNGRFVVVSSVSAKSAYSFDGITWYESTVPMVGNKLSYGQGVFLALPTGLSPLAYISDSGLVWKEKTVTTDGYGAVSFGFTDNSQMSRSGWFATLSSSNTASRISAGVRTKGRPVITSSVITSISEWEPGSGYISEPTVTFTDPNITSLATVTARRSNGVLASPTFINRGSGYNTNSTSVSITGNGYADKYQTGLSIVVNNLTRLPQPGDNITFQGINQIYKVTSARAVYGTTAPNLEANVEIAPDMSVTLSPENNSAVSIRTKYSQARLTNHDFLNIGYGGVEASNYPGIPDTGYSARSQNQTLEVNYGRVFYTSTDQDGNFKVGNLFGVQQATGIVTLSATQFGLTGLSTLSLGGIAVGGSSVIISQFSTDGTFTANSDTIVPTQKAIKTYLTGRLSQGGSNTATGQLIAGTITVGGPDKIGSTVPNGTAGSVINMPNQVIFTGQYAGVDGDIAALDFFVRGFTRRGNYF